ncbi:hypothetical protein ACFVGM_09245 [Kitasatospora purpeofusca]|uniref:hypothetical protein n=1 Tax=Kitasatospora purpeofusca TaxID=67352 RepID=UPI0036CF28FE
MPKSALDQVKELIAERDAERDKLRDANGDCPNHNQYAWDQVSAGFEYEVGQLIDGLVREIDNPQVFTVVVESAADDFLMDLVVVTVRADSEDEAEQAALRAAEQSFMDNSGRSADELAEMKTQESAHFDVQGLFVGRNLRMPSNATEIDLTEKES